MNINRLESRIHKLKSNLTNGGALLNQLENYQELLADSVSYLNNRSQKVAFIGNIGTGKTTAICSLIGLMNNSKPILSVGSGRTTLCEVEISKGQKTRILIEPYEKKEILDYIKDLALSVVNENSNDNDGETFKLSAEIDRALRNILGLPKSKKTIKDTNKRYTYDPLPLLYSSSASFESFYSKLEGLFDYSKRTKVEFTNQSKKTESEWLSDTFKSINHGTNENSSLAKKISIELECINWEHPDFELTFLDTKGVDQTVNRRDLDNCLTDNRTVSVLCSRFNDAPDTTTAGVLKQAKDAGLINRVNSESLILVLDRDNEPEQIIEIDEPVNDKDEGREIRREQIQTELKNKLALDVDIEFYNSTVDNNLPIISKIKDKINNLRAFHNSRIREIEKEISDLEREALSLSQKEAKSKVADTLQPWLKKAKTINLHTNEYFLPLVQSISSKGTYAASVRASVNRSGEWQNLDYYQILASGARQRVVEHIGVLRLELEVLLENMSNQPDLKPAHALIRQLRDTADKRLTDLINQAYAKGRAVYESDLRHDVPFWRELYNEWGQGSGYKQRISKTTHNWFNIKNYPKYEENVTDTAIGQWNNLVVEISGLSGA